MMRTSKEKAAAEMAIRSMSDKAREAYAGLSPFEVYEYDTPDGKRYDTTYAIARDGLTFEELQELLEDMAEIEEENGETEEDDDE